ncbi:gamma-glutamyl-gamma-aminobutyrate hydrolase family protein [Campylobacter felis]|uniref:gamma-glutamyl-CDP-amidate hydrolase n=1 Tax=Campylobacter felis TaxID=2974565 RepID=UPI0025683C24|nr:gamma-glutamyl-gamma-aminobutyrate hydrolase family protein [Campylobacter felis]
MFIGVSQRLLLNESYYELREALALEWGEFFKENLKPFLPLPLSYEIDFKAYAPHLRGVILSGGNDLATLNPSPLSLKRDAYEAQILTHCLEENLPLLGICRGAQFIAHFFGSTLSPCENHTQEHAIRLTNDTQTTINSFHNYAIATLGQALEPLAFAEDGTVEAFRHRGAKIWALMWHIERANGLNERSIFREWLENLREKR